MKSTLIQEMLNRANRHTHVPKHRIIGASQKFTDAAIRCAIYIALREKNLAFYSLSELGRIFGRDHTTVRSAILNRRRFEQKYKWFAPLIEKLLEPEDTGEPLCRWHPV